MISFKEDTHQYTWLPTGEIFTSVSQLLSRYKKPFDKEGHSKRIAKREGVKPDEILDRWQDINDQSTTKGKKYHKVLEDYVTTGKVDEELKWLCYQFDRNIFDRYTTVQAEKIVWDERNKIAGMSDLIVDFDDEFSIIDFKTNKHFRTYNKFNEYLLEPIQYLQQCEYNNYNLQLSLYAYMYEKLSYKRVRNLEVFYIHDQKIKIYNMPYMKLEVLSILKHNRDKHNG